MFILQRQEEDERDDPHLVVHLSPLTLEGAEETNPGQHFLFK